MTKDVFIKEVRDAEAMLYHISKSILKNDSDCGDAVQETILKAYEKLSTLPSTNKDARMYQRMMLSKAAECEMDGQGRILIPSSLVALAGLEKECLIIGVANHLEIWSKERWERLEEEQSASFEEAAEHLSGLMG